MNAMDMVIPGRRVGEKYVRLVSLVLTVSECGEWIAFAESNGFAPASLSSDGKTKNPHRNNDRALIFDAKRADALFDRLKPFLPTTWKDEETNTTWELLGFNDRLSFLRYVTEEHYGKHVDVPFLIPQPNLAHLSLLKSI